MADEQPGHINRDVRDVAKVPQVEDLVRNNVGSTVRDNSKFKAVSETDAAVASTLYLDPAIQTAHPSPKQIQDTSRQPSTATGADIERAIGGARCNKGSSESRPAGRAVEAQTEVRTGPVVFMSDVINYAGSHNPNCRQSGDVPRQAKCRPCCVS
eukprot:jgi/Undpi1/8334/HiC_scaffold_25.g10803.m1